MSNEYGPITDEMVRAMVLDRSVIENPYGDTVTYDPATFFGCPFVFTTSDGIQHPMREKQWKYPSWRIRREPKLRPMTRLERLGVLTREGCVARYSGGEWETPNSYAWHEPKEDTGRDEWAIIDQDGNIIDGPHKFVVEERAI